MKLNLSERELFILLDALTHKIEGDDMTPDYRSEVVHVRTILRDIFDNHADTKQ